jgi:hypothetical protein
MSAQMTAVSRATAWPAAVGPERETLREGEYASNSALSQRGTPSFLLPGSQVTGRFCPFYSSFASLPYIHRREQPRISFDFTFLPHISSLHFAP